MAANESQFCQPAETFPDPALLAAVGELVDERVRVNVPASSLTTFAIGGPLSVVVTVESEHELQSVLALLHREGQSVRVLGFGSNLLVADAGVRGWIVRLGPQFREVRKDSGEFFVLGGAGSLMSLSRKISEDGYSGFEFAAGIPASIGGATFMNAGAHGSEIGGRIVEVCGVLAHGDRCQWRGEDLPWRYRNSGLPAGAIVTAIRVRLTPGDRGAIAKACADNLSHRRATQPLALPSAGSVFKNPSSEVTAGKLLDSAGLKGVTVGGASVSTLHANWIVNPDKRATASDVRELIQRCTREVRERVGIVLEPEVKIWE